MKQVTIGKIRGIQQLSNAKGIFAICSLDHRRSLRKMMSEGASGPVTPQNMVEFKLELCEVLAPHATGILIDPIYGASQCVAARAIPGSTGLLISLEIGTQSPCGPVGVECDDATKDWDVTKVKAMGASGLKFPLYYRPDLPNVASEKLNAVVKYAYDCKQADLALFLGPKNYTVIELERDPWEYARKKPSLAVDTVYQLSRLPVDVLKIEFPSDMTYEQDQKKMLDICQQVTEASLVPWVLMSGGVNFEVFSRQLEIACKGGASGFLAGRALWQEATTMPTRSRLKFLESTTLERLKRLTEIADAHAKPWYHKLQPRNNYLQSEFDEFQQIRRTAEKLTPAELPLSENFPVT